MKPFGGTTHVPLFGDGDEVLQLSETHGESGYHEANRVRHSIPRRYWIRSANPWLQRDMSIERFSVRQWEALRAAGRVAAATLKAVGGRLAVGLTTQAIDDFVRVDTSARGGRPSQLGYRGFPAAVCTSRNHVVCHGMPSSTEVLRDGDIINVDVTTEYGGFHGDTSRTFAIGEPSPEAARVVCVAERCLWAGIGVVRHGARVGDIGAAIVEMADREGCSVVRDYCGHGIGRRMHSPPQVPHVGRRGRGVRLKSGMVITIEPMINLGGAEVRTLEDGWTVVTCDGSLSAQFEHTVLVTERGAEVLTHS